MQIQKDEIRAKIIEVAEQEFLKHGFKGASMRTIAKKAHTTLGNIYNYFENKEEIFDAVVGDIPKLLEELIHNHETQEREEEISLIELKEKMQAFMPKAFGFDVMLSTSFVILMECSEGTRYEGYEKAFYEMACEHMISHVDEIFPDRQHPLLAATLTQSFIASTLFIARYKKSLQEGIEELVNFIAVMISGLVAMVPQQKEGNSHDQS